MQHRLSSLSPDPNSDVIIAVEKGSGAYLSAKSLAGF